MSTESTHKASWADDDELEVIRPEKGPEVRGRQ